MKIQPIVIIVCELIIILSLVLFATPIKAFVFSDTGNKQVEYYQVSGDDFIIKFEPSGTHIKNNLLKVRFDVYPQEGTKSYVNYYKMAKVVPPEGGYKGALDTAGMPIDIQDYQAWYGNLPSAWRLTPCLSLFIVVDRDTTEVEITEYLSVIFTPEVLKQLDNALLSSESRYAISELMNGKSVLIDEGRIETSIEYHKVEANQNVARLIINSRLDSYEIGIDVSDKVISP